MNTEQRLKVFPLERMAHGAAMARQLELVDRCLGSGGAENFLLSVEHPPVITLGRSSAGEDMRRPRGLLRRCGVEVVETNRGGKTTYHGPGQLVLYPIIDLRLRGRDLHRYLRDLEGWLIELLARYGITARTDPRNTGVWVDGGKIASIGIAVRRWVAYHGAALNVNTDMKYFDYIVPCGLEGVRMVSMAALLERTVPLRQVAEDAARLFGERFDLTPDPPPDAPGAGGR